MAKVHIALDRAQAGAAMDIAESAWDAYQAGQTWDQIAADMVVDAAVKKYQGHIRAGLARVGVELADGEVLDGATLLRIINNQTGLSLAAFTPEDVITAVSGKVSAKMSDVIGVDLVNVRSGDDLRAQLIQAAKTAVITGRGNGLITQGLVNRIRAKATWIKSGIDPLEQKRLKNQIYQKRYRRKHVEVWREPGEL